MKNFTWLSIVSCLIACGCVSDDSSGPDECTRMQGRALLVTGTIPLVGTDVVFKTALEARGLEVEVVQESEATRQDAAGKRLIMLSYGMSSTLFNAEAFVDLPVPMIVTERNLLPRLKMSSVSGYTDRMTALKFISDHPLAGGHANGEVEV